MERVVFITKSSLVSKAWSLCFDKTTEITILNTNEQINKFIFEQDDIVLFDFESFENKLENILSKSKILCLAENKDELEAYRLLKYGLNGYDSINIDIKTLKLAMDTIKKNKVWIYPELMSFIIKNSTIPMYKNEVNNIHRLTNKELEVAKLVSEGLTNKEIAEQLNITLRTVKAHVSSSFFKLELKDRLSLAMYIKEFYS